MAFCQLMAIKLFLFQTRIQSVFELIQTVFSQNSFPLPEKNMHSDRKRETTNCLFSIGIVNIFHSQSSVLYSFRHPFKAWDVEVKCALLSCLIRYSQGYDTIPSHTNTERERLNENVWSTTRCHRL